MQKLCIFTLNLDLIFLSPFDCFAKSSGKIKTQGWFLIGLGLPVCARQLILLMAIFSFQIDDEFSWRNTYTYIKIYS